VSNFGALAILAVLPEDAPARQWRLLTALETFPADAGGWRCVSTAELCRAAKIGSRRTLRRGRHELTAAGLIEYEPGAGRRNFTRWRIMFPLDLPPPKKGATQVDPFSSPRKGATQLDPLSAAIPDAKRGHGQRRKGVTVGAEKGSPPKPGISGTAGALSSGNTASGADGGWSTALEPSALEPSALVDPSHPSSPADVEGSHEPPPTTNDDQDFSGNSEHPRPAPGRDAPPGPKAAGPHAFKIIQPFARKHGLSIHVGAELERQAAKMLSNGTEAKHIKVALPAWLESGKPPEALSEFVGPPR
jgi:hypothetical protein